MVVYNEHERKGKEAVVIYAGIWQNVLRKPVKHFRISSISDRIRAQHFPNKSLKRYGFSQHAR
jgi:hypothetical protein